MMRIINITSVVILVIMMAPSCFMEYVRPGSIGIRRSLEGGIAERDYPVGYHLALPFWHRWHQVDGTLHYLEYSIENNNAYEIRTKDGNLIQLDLIIPYRISDHKAWEIAQQGYINDYEIKVKSTADGVLRKMLANLSSLDALRTEARETVSAQALPALNEALARYHVEATHVVISGMAFPSHYEEQLQNKQYFVAQGKLAEAQQTESEATQETDTLEKMIAKQVAIKREEWNEQIEKLNAKYSIEIAEIESESAAYVRTKKAEADALFTEMKAEGDLAEAKADALGQRLRSEALATKAGRTFSAIEAARNFKIGELQLNSQHPDFLNRFGSMKAWRVFFLGE